jgi:hypothetical protein
MWRRDQVSWNHSSKNGELWGFFGGWDYDFAAQKGVYVLYDEGRKPIYVGQVGSGERRLFGRLRAHTHDQLQHRWQYFSWFGLLNVNPGSGNLTRRDDPAKRVRGTIRSMLNEIEGVLIAATEPPFNKQGARFRHIPRYKQVRPDKEKNVTTEELRSLITKVDLKVTRLIKITKRNN